MLCKFCQWKFARDSQSNAVNREQMSSRSPRKFYSGYTNTHTILKHALSHTHSTQTPHQNEIVFPNDFWKLVTSSQYSKFLLRGFLHIGNSMRRSTPSDCQTDSSTGTAATTGNQMQPQQQLTHVSFDDDSCDSNRWGKNGGSISGCQRKKKCVEQRRDFFISREHLFSRLIFHFLLSYFCCLSWNQDFHLLTHSIHHCVIRHFR